MDALFNFLNEGWVGAIIGLLGIWLAVHFYRRSRQGAQLAYHYWWTRVLGFKGHKLPPPVKILFHDQPIENLCRSLVLIWNYSDKTIDGGNIVETDCLRIDMGEGAQVLDARIVKRTRDVNKCNTTLLLQGDEAKIGITFDYLDSGDGCVVEVFHTESGKAPVLRGSIREMPSPFKNYKQQFPLMMIGIVFRSVGILLGVLLTYIGVLALVVVINEPRTVKEILGMLAILAVGLAIALGAGRSLVRNRRRYPKSLSMPQFFGD